MNKEGCETSGQALVKYACAVIGGFFLGVLLVGLYLMPPKDSGQLAAWAQALGALFALLGVYWATQKQARISIDAIRESGRLRNEERTQASLVILKGGLLVAREIKDIIIKNQQDESKHWALRYLSMVNDLESNNFNLRLRLTYKERIERVDPSNFREEKALNSFISYLTIFEAIMIQLPLTLRGAYRHPFISEYLMEIKDEGKRSKAADSANKAQVRGLLEQIDLLEKKYEEIALSVECD